MKKSSARKTSKPTALSPRDRARIRRAIHWLVSLESGQSDARKREARLRMAIGLKPPRDQPAEMSPC
jgi:hypothetical protein